MIRSRVLIVALALLAAVIPSSALGAKKTAPDLAVAKLSKPPAALDAGAKLTIALEVRNRGAAAAGKSRATLYLARGAKHTSRDVVLGHAKVKALPAGGKATAKLTVDLPLKATGSGYRLIACADSGKRVREAKEGNNCMASRKFQLTSPAPAKPPPGPGPLIGDIAAPHAPAFTMTDGIDWGFAIDENGIEPAAGEPVTLTLRAGNRIPGQAGYNQASVAAAPLLTGTTSTLDYGNRTDDGALTVDLPFAFPFGGIVEQTVSISTNGWISFGAPAWDFWDDEQLRDYRGAAAVVGEFERGIMPYWADLTLSDRSGSGGGTVRKVVAADGSAVAFQWEADQLDADGLPRRVFQVVLFPDGSFRFDYPGANAGGGRRAFVGFSPGTGPASATILSTESTEVPASSILFTPNPPFPGASSNLPAGEVTATLPVRGNLLDASPGCELTRPSSATSEGLVTCPVPALMPGQQSTQTVTFAMPPNAPGEVEPANFRLRGSYETAGPVLSDGDEINALSGALPPATIDLVAAFNSPAIPRPGVPAVFSVDLEVPTTQASLDEPVVTFELPDDTTLELIQSAGKGLPCGPVTESGLVTCRLPSGISFTTIGVSVVPSVASVGSELTLGVTANALNTPPATASVTTPPVQAP